MLDLKKLIRNDSFISIALNVLCILISTIIPVLAICTVNTKIPFLMLDNFWIAVVFLPLPILSIIFYGVCSVKHRSNLIIGIIMILYLLFLSMLSLFPKTSYNSNYDSVLRYESILQIEFPEKMKVVNTNDEFKDSSLNDRVKVFSTSYIHFYKNSQKEITKQIKNNNNWVNENLLSSDLKDLIESIPSIVVSQSNNGYYSIYVEQIDKYNELPSENGTYTVYISYYTPSTSDLQIEVVEYLHINYK